MDIDKLDLPKLIKAKDHLNVLRYIRVFELRQPQLVVEHGQAWLGKDFAKSGGVNMIIRNTCLEQIALAALDIKQEKLAEQCLDQLKASGAVDKDSVRFRRLLARCLEASGDQKGAELIYQDILQATPANASASKRLYALQKAQVGDAAYIQGQDILCKYLEEHPSDAAAWWELADCRKYLGDFSGAAYCLEECLLASTPLEPELHIALAECWATAAAHPKKQEHPLQMYLSARQHMAQALELDSTNTRAAWGLLQCSNLYLQFTEIVAKESSKKAEPVDPFQDQVAEALMEHAIGLLKDAYKGTPMEKAVGKLVQEYMA